MTWVLSIIISILLFTESCVTQAQVDNNSHTPEQLMDQQRRVVFSLAPKEIDLNGYEKTDPNHFENKQLMDDAFSKTYTPCKPIQASNRKLLDYTRNDTDSFRRYYVRSLDDHITQEYSDDGQLLSISILFNNAPLKHRLYYSYPSGKLTEFDIYPNDITYRKECGHRFDSNNAMMHYECDFEMTDPDMCMDPPRSMAEMEGF